MTMDNFEQRVQQIAKHFPYPPTPEFQPEHPPKQRPMTYIQPRLARLLAATAIILLGLFAIPSIRAAVLDLLQIGAIQIRVGEQPPDDQLPTILESLSGEVTLEEARQMVTFPLRLPSDYGQPDHVYIQDWGGKTVIMVWLTDDESNQIEFALYHIGPGGMATKALEDVETTRVHENLAFWTTQNHLIQMKRNGLVRDDLVFLVDGHILIWAQGEITYRLESQFDLQQAIQIAESLE